MAADNEPIPSLTMSPALNAKLEQLAVPDAPGNPSPARPLYTNRCTGDSSCGLTNVFAQKKFIRPSC